MIKGAGMNKIDEYMNATKYITHGSRHLTPNRFDESIKIEYCENQNIHPLEKYKPVAGLILSENTFNNTTRSGFSNRDSFYSKINNGDMIKVEDIFQDITVAKKNLASFNYLAENAVRNSSKLSFAQNMNNSGISASKSMGNEIVDIIKRESQDLSETRTMKIKQAINKIQPFYKHLNRKSAIRLIDLIQESNRVHIFSTKPKVNDYQENTVVNKLSDTFHSDFRTSSHSNFNLSNLRSSKKVIWMNKIKGKMGK